MRTMDEKVTLNPLGYESSFFSLRQHFLAGWRILSYCCKETVEAVS